LLTSFSTWSVAKLSDVPYQQRIKGNARFWLTFATLFYIRSYTITLAARGVVWVFARFARPVFLSDKDTKDTVLVGLTVSFVSLAADRSHDAGARRPLGKFGVVWRIDIFAFVSYLFSGQIGLRGPWLGWKRTPITLLLSEESAIF
jgi:hypothetical protein